MTLAHSHVPANSEDTCGECRELATIKLILSRGMRGHYLCGKHADQLIEDLRRQR